MTAAVALTVAVVALVVAATCWAALIAHRRWTRAQVELGIAVRRLAARKRAELEELDQ